MKRETTAATLPSGIALPEGLELVNRGGRPAKVARDVGVLLARQLKFEELSTMAKADAWIVDHWRHRGLTLPEHVRKRCAEAHKRLPRKFTLFVLRDRGVAGLVESDPNGPRVLTIDGLPVAAGALPGGVSWLWHTSLHEAVEARVSIQADLGTSLSPIAAALRR